MAVQVRRAQREPITIRRGRVVVRISGAAAVLVRTLTVLARLVGVVIFAVTVENTSRRRHWWAPGWVLVVVLGCAWLDPSTAVLLAAAGVGCIAKASAWGGHVLSRREWGLLGWALVTGAAWVLLHAAAAGSVNPRASWLEFGALGVGWLMYAVPWWHGRRIRRPALTEPAVAPVLVQVWVAVEAAVPALVGSWTDVEDAADGSQSGVLRLSNARADEVAKLGPEVESVITRRTTLSLKSGSIRMQPVTGGSVNELWVQLHPDPAARAERKVYLEPGQLVITPDGMLPLGPGADGKTWSLPIRRPSGAAHVLITGASGAGKGGLTNLLGTALAMDADTWVAAIDLKGGAGIPGLRAGVDLYARRPQEWVLAMEIVRDITLARQARYGDAGHNAWSTRTDPQVVALIDEMWRLGRTGTSQRERRRVIEMVDLVAAQGRSLGVSLMGNTQRGDGPSVASTGARANMLGGGTALMLRPGDGTARRVAAQDFNVDVNDLPLAPGWVFPLSGIMALPQHPIRVRYLPTAAEAADGEAAPHGTVEDWVRDDTIRARLHPEDAAIAARWDHSPAPAIDPTALTASSGLTHEPPAPAAAGAHGVEWRVESGDGPGVSAGHTHARPSTPPSTPPLSHAGHDAAPGPEEVEEAPLRHRILDALADGPLTRGEVMRRAGTTDPSYTSKLLRELRAAGLVVQHDGTWHLAPTPDDASALTPAPTGASARAVTWPVRRAS